MNFTRSDIVVGKIKAFKGSTTNSGDSWSIRSPTVDLNLSGNKINIREYEILLSSSTFSAQRNDVGESDSSRPRSKNTIGWRRRRFPSTQYPGNRFWGFSFCAFGLRFVENPRLRSFPFFIAFSICRCGLDTRLGVRLLIIICTGYCRMGRIGLGFLVVL